MTTYEYQNFELRKLAGKTILITGGATGLGRAAVKLAYSRSLHSRNTPELDELQGMERMLLWATATKLKGKP